MKTHQQNTRSIQAVCTRSSKRDRVPDLQLDYNSRTVVAYDEFGGEHAFKKIATVPYKSDNAETMYIILRPLNEFLELENDEAYAFRIGNGERDGIRLFFESDEKRAAEVFEIYFAMIDLARATDNRKKES